jgi:hypothetical protein
MMRPLLRYSLALAAVLVAGAALADDSKTALGRWMKPNMGDPFGKDPVDFATLATSFATVASHPPDATKYPGWAAIAQRGAAAAAKSDKDGVKGACNDCHKAAATDGTSKNRKVQYQADPNVAKTFP